MNSPTPIEKLVRIIDCETTGMDPESDRIVELASLDWTDDGFSNSQQFLVNPGIPIPATASAVHHITDTMVADAPSIEAVFPLFEGAPIYCAHNARFDQGFIPFKAHWICTYKVALHLWRDAPGHSNQVLRYHLGIESPPAEAGEMAHRALYDVWTTARLFERMLGELSVKEMVQISMKPALLPKLTFGKHANVPIEDVPKDYLSWITTSGKFDDDEDVIHTARHYLTFSG